MAKTNHNQLSSELSLAKFGNLFFARQTPSPSAATHASIFGAIGDLFNAWRKQRNAAGELARLSDRELSDIGVTRQQIPTLVRIRR